MKINLMQGSFETKDALEMITKMIAVKIKFHEDKISKGDSEEDIKMRETRIRQLQKDLYDTRSYIEKLSEDITIQAEITIHANQALGR